MTSQLGPEFVKIGVLQKIDLFLLYIAKFLELRLILS